MRALAILALLAAGCSGAMAPLPPNKCELDAEFRIWLSCEACQSPAGMKSVGDPCRPGTITIACDRAACTVPTRCQIGNGEAVACAGGATWYGPGDKQCSCANVGDKCLAVPLDGEPSAGVCVR